MQRKFFIHKESINFFLFLRALGHNLLCLQKTFFGENKIFPIQIENSFLLYNVALKRSYLWLPFKVTCLLMAENNCSSVVTGTGQKILTRVGSSQPSLIRDWKISLKIPQKIIFPHRIKKISSGWVKMHPGQRRLLRIKKEKEEKRSEIWPRKQEGVRITTRKTGEKLHPGK